MAQVTGEAPAPKSAGAASAPGEVSGNAAPAPQDDLPLHIISRGVEAPDTPRTAAQTSPIRKLIVFGVALAVVVGGLGYAWIASRSGPQSPAEAVDPADIGRRPQGTVVAPPPRGSVAGLGKILPRGRIITLAPPFGAGDARIARLLVEEGQQVPAGTLLAALDSETNFRAVIASAEANAASREAALRQTLLITRTSLDGARATLARAEAAANNTKRELERTQTLIARGNATDQLLDQRRLAYEQALQDVEQMRATLNRYDYGDINDHPDVMVARRNFEAARADLEKARADIEKAYVRAPTDGTVLTIAARAGEKPGAQGLMTFGDLSDMIAEIEVYEDQIIGIRKGMRVVLTADPLPKPLAGTVERLGIEVLRQTLVDASPAANTDTRVLRVTVALDEPSRALASRFANMQVTARFGIEPKP